MKSQFTRTDTISSYRNVPFRFLLLPSFLISFFAGSVFARAGGGGGGGGGGFGGGLYHGGHPGTTVISYNPIFDTAFTIGWLLLVCASVIYGVIMTIIAFRKHGECRELQKQIASHDSRWDFEYLKKRTEEVYFKVQRAWTERNQEIAKDCMTDALYELHKSLTDAMIEKHEKNILKDIKFLGADVVGIEDFNNNNKDRVWMLIKGSMIDYIIDDTDDRIKSGSDNTPESFRELWKFVRQDNV